MSHKTQGICHSGWVRSVTSDSMPQISGKNSLFPGPGVFHNSEAASGTDRFLFLLFCFCFCFLVVSVVGGNSLARDPTSATAVTRATALITVESLIARPPGNSMSIFKLECLLGWCRRFTGIWSMIGIQQAMSGFADRENHVMRNLDASNSYEQPWAKIL